MSIENPKTLDQLIDFFNENPVVFGWKSKCEELIIFAERLEQELAEARAEIERKDALIEQMREALEIAYKYLHAHAERTKDKYVIKDLLTVKAAIAAAKGEV